MIILTLLGELFSLDVLGSPLGPLFGVALVDAVDLPALGNFHVWVGEDKLTDALCG